MKLRIAFSEHVRAKLATIGCEGMAKYPKRQSPPFRAIEAPKALVPLMQAFHVDSEKAAKALIAEAARAIYGKDDFGSVHSLSKSELDGVASLMKCINPRDSLETLYAAQIVVGHLLGMRKLAENYADDQKLGLNLLRFSNEAMQQLEKKRDVGTQNITINYNYSGHGNALMQTVIPDKGA